jgi:hypothetical protein
MAPQFGHRGLRSEGAWEEVAWLPTPQSLSPARPKTGGAFSWTSFPSPALCKRAHGGLASRGTAVRLRARFAAGGGFGGLGGGGKPTV